MTVETPAQRQALLERTVADFGEWWVLPGGERVRGLFNHPRVDIYDRQGVTPYVSFVPEQVDPLLLSVDDDIAREDGGVIYKLQEALDGERGWRSFQLEELFRP